MLVFTVTKKFFSKFKAKAKRLRRRDWMLIVASLGVSTIVLIMTFFFPFDDEQWSAAGYLGVALVNIMAAAALYSPIPAWLVSFRAAEYLNPITIILISSIAVTIGESTKYFFGEGLEHLVNDYKWHKRLSKLFLWKPFLFLVVWIALPNPIQSLGEVFAGSTKYPIHKYLLATLIGNLIWFMGVVALGRFFLT
jgi:uncharacterized membrane protein YdjX (TVP38/TMEM64 family)